MHEAVYSTTNGQGVAQDYDKAREWYEKAADAGRRIRHDETSANFTTNGQGVTQDYAKAREWYEKAADKRRRGSP